MVVDEVNILVSQEKRLCRLGQGDKLAGTSLTYFNIERLCRVELHPVVMFSEI